MGFVLWCWNDYARQWLARKLNSRSAIVSMELYPDAEENSSDQ